MRMVLRLETSSEEQNLLDSERRGQLLPSARDMTTQFQSYAL